MFLIAAAQAYEIAGDPWPAEAFPLEIHWTGAVDGLDATETAAAVEGAVAAWSDALPCGQSLEAVEDPDAAAWFAAGGNTIRLGDPDDELADGVIALANVGDGSPAAEDLVVNDGFPFASDAAIEAGTCADALSLQGLLTHELGHLLGLGHSCEEGEACTDADAADATMYGSQPFCDTNASSLGQDDRDGIAALYPGALALSITCTSEADLTVTCTGGATEPIDTLSPTWTFGDGGTATGGSATHTYAEAGTYTVELCVTPEGCDPTCTSTELGLAYDVDSGGPDTGDTGGTKGEGCGCGGGAPTGAMSILLAIGALRRRS